MTSQRKRETPDDEQVLAELRQDYANERIAKAEDKAEKKRLMQDQTVGTMPKVAVIFAMVIGPIGALLGHLGLAWSKDELRYNENMSVLKSRRWSWVAVFVGWFMTAVTLGGIGLWYSAEAESRAQSEAEDELMANQEQVRQEVIAAAPDSPSAGEVDAAFCEVVVDDLYHTGSNFGVVLDYRMIPEDSVAAFEHAGSDAVTTPNGAVYSDYADHLAAVSDGGAAAELSEVDMLTDAAEHAEPVLVGLNDDILGCVDLDESYVDTLLETQFQDITGTTTEQE